ncbi:MAG: pyrroline-5-carboxylate reductase [Pseudomonadota bacterium]
MFEELNRRGLVLLGCGKMGSALLKGWLKGGLAPEAVTVFDPAPPDWLGAHAEIGINRDPPAPPGVAVLAVKPQMMESALPRLRGYGGGGTLFLSIAAGLSLGRLARWLGADTPVVRAMPNTPASVGRGITALIGSGAADADALAMAEQLMGAVGQTVRLEDEAQMDAVTALSGSGPAYVFHMIEALAAAGEAEGLSPDLAMALARATVGGAGLLAEEADESPGELRVHVTSPAGTTEAGLKVLMDGETGLPPLMARTVAAAAARSRELDQ